MDGHLNQLKFLIRLSKRSFTVNYSPNLTETFSYDDMRKHYGENLIPFFLIEENKRLFVSTIENPIEPESGDSVIALIKENNKKTES